MARARAEKVPPPAFRRLKPGPGKSPEAVESDQRARLQRAMVELVAAGGRRGATVRKLTKLAGVSTATFYSQFDGTDECLVSTYVSLMDRVRERVAGNRASPGRRRRPAEGGLRLLVDALLEDPCAARLILIEIFDAGPAAIGPIRVQETMLEATFRKSLERDGLRVHPPTVAWVVAGVLHCARQMLGSDSGPGALETTHSLLRWAQACLAEQEPGPCESGASTNAVGRSVEPRAAVRRPPRQDETDLFVNAVLRLSCTEGYWKLSLSRASRTAGIPATHFKRYFRSLDEAYLLAVERTARGLFAGFGSRTRDGVPHWSQALHEQIASLSASLASAPQIAGVVFAGILAPGAEGLTRRETLIDELAATWRLSLPARERPSALIAKASMAALWSAFARAAELDRPDALPERAPTNAGFFLAPMPGSENVSAPGGRTAVPAGA